MTTPVRSNIFPLGCAALLSLLGCNPGESASPTPEATASATPTPSATTPSCCQAPYGRWAAVVVYTEAGGKCDKIAGPPRVGARRGEDVIWRVYNRCRKEQSVKIRGLKFLGLDVKVPSVEDDIYRMKQEQSAVPGKQSPDEPDDPFVSGNRSVTVKAGGTADLKLTVKRNAKYGVYSYITYLSDKPDADQQIEIWP